MQDCCRCDAI
ncbi:hypothetical protein OYC64_004528 [Pagothenia borchgrevinki]|uniref:Uncharacterized protein n=1 Tax=Pagothenia borchgrevinki TaxID=8213 RepID=A0ABD2FYQ8_PAGBO